MMPWPRSHGQIVGEQGPRVSFRFRCFSHVCGFRRLPSNLWVKVPSWTQGESFQQNAIQQQSPLLTRRSLVPAGQEAVCPLPVFFLTLAALLSCRILAPRMYLTSSYIIPTPSPTAFKENGSSDMKTCSASAIRPTRGPGGSTSLFLPF